MRFFPIFLVFAKYFTYIFHAHTQTNPQEPTVLFTAVQIEHEGGGVDFAYPSLQTLHW